MIYFDTSAVVPLVLPEPSSGVMHAWMAGTDRTALTLSDWTVAEFASALGVQFRTRSLTRMQATAAWSELWRHVLESFAVLTPTHQDFDLAARLVLRFDLGLRAGDALHVAIAQNAGATSFVTLDRRLAAAAEHLGLACEAPA
jgi:predicted nucleic acid-binding protein